MFSTDCPAQFWKAVGRLTSWRLLTYDGFRTGAFTTASGSTVQIGPEVANMIDGLVCVIGELVESAECLGDIALDLAVGSRKQRSNAKKELEGDYRRFKTNLEGLKQDLPHLFAHYAETELDDIPITSV